MKKETLKGWFHWIFYMSNTNGDALAKLAVWILIAGSFFYLSTLDYSNIFSNFHVQELVILFSIIPAFLNQVKLFFLIIGLLCVIPILAILIAGYKIEDVPDKRKINKYHIVSKYVTSFDLLILFILIEALIFLSSIAIFFNLFSIWSFGRIGVLICGLIVSSGITIILGIAIKKGITWLAGKELVPFFIWFKRKKK